MARTRQYRDGELVREDFPVSEISDCIVVPNAFVWLDHCEPTGEELATIAPYYQDVYDHVLRATDWTESLRDLVTTILETNIAIQGNRMNLVTFFITRFIRLPWIAIFVATNV